MDKIASPQDLQAEIQLLITSCSQGKPSRSVLAREMSTLAYMVQAASVSTSVSSAVKALQKIDGKDVKADLSTLGTALKSLSAVARAMGQGNVMKPIDSAARQAESGLANVPPKNYQASVGKIDTAEQVRHQLQLLHTACSQDNPSRDKLAARLYELAGCNTS